jgi:hypothetical protein
LAFIPFNFASTLVSEAAAVFDDTTGGAVGLSPVSIMLYKPPVAAWALTTGARWTSAGEEAGAVNKSAGVVD